MEACSYGGRAACASQTLNEAAPAPPRPRRSAHAHGAAHAARTAHIPHATHTAHTAQQPVLPPHTYIARISCPIRRRFYEQMASARPAPEARCNRNDEQKEKDNDNQRKKQYKPVQIKAPPSVQATTWRSKRTVVESIREWEKNTREMRRQNNYVPTVGRRKNKNKVEAQHRRNYMQPSASVPHNKTQFQPKKQQRVCEFHRQQCPVHGAFADVGWAQTRRGRSESEPSLHSQGVQALLKQPRKSVSCSKKCINPRLYPAHVASRLAPRETTFASPQATKMVVKSASSKLKTKSSHHKDERPRSRPYMKEILKDPALSPQNYYTPNVYKNNIFNNKQININGNDYSRAQDARYRMLRSPYFNQKLCYNCNYIKTDDRRANFNMPFSESNERFARYNNVRNVESQMSGHTLSKHNASSQVSAASVPIVINNANLFIDKLLTKSSIMHVDIKPKDGRSCSSNKARRFGPKSPIDILELTRQQSTFSFFAALLRKLSAVVPVLTDVKYEMDFVPEMPKTDGSDIYHDTEMTITGNPDYPLTGTLAETHTTEICTCTDFLSESDLTTMDGINVPLTQNVALNTQPENLSSSPKSQETDKTSLSSLPKSQYIVPSLQKSQDTVPFSPKSHDTDKTSLSSLPKSQYIVPFSQKSQDADKTGPSSSPKSQCTVPFLQKSEDTDKNSPFSLPKSQYNTLQKSHDTDNTCPFSSPKSQDTDKTGPSSLLKTQFLVPDSQKSQYTVTSLQKSHNTDKAGPFSSPTSQDTDETGLSSSPKSQKTVFFSHKSQDTVPSSHKSQDTDKTGPSSLPKSQNTVRSSKKSQDTVPSLQKLQDTYRTGPSSSPKSQGTVPSSQKSQDSYKTVSNTQPSAVNKVFINKVMSSETSEPFFERKKRIPRQPMQSAPRLTAYRQDENIDTRLKGNKQTFTSLTYSLTQRPKKSSVTSCDNIIPVKKKKKSDAITCTKSDAFFNAVTRSESNQTTTKMELQERKINKSEKARSRQKRLLTVTQRNKMYKNRLSSSLNSSPERNQRESSPCTIYKESEK